MLTKGGSVPDCVDAYTTSGQMQTRIWARLSGGLPLTTTYSYHAATGDLTGVDYSDATPDVAYTRDRLGRVLTAGVCTYTYDPATLQLATETAPVGLTAATRTLTRSYDALLRPTGYVLKNGSTVETSAAQTYDAAGRLATVVHHPHSASPLTFTYGYTTGRPKLLASVTGPVHTVSKTWEAQRNVLSQISNEIAGAPLSRYTYTVNALGQRTAVATTGSAFGGSPANWSWGYNPKGEVTSATHGSVTSRNSAWTFDDIGNRLTQSVGTVPALTSYTTNLLNQYTTISHPTPSTETPVHDLDGNLIQDATKKYVWDAENRLTEVLRASDDAVIARYQYDHLGRRVRKTTTSLAPQGTADVAYSYDGWNVVAEYVMPGGFSFVSRTRTWGVDLSGSPQGAGGVGGLLADGDVIGGLWYPTYDGNGNVSEYVSKTGAIAAHYEYDAFGNTVFASGALSAPAFACRFSTKAFDVETGWYYYGYRYYDSVRGRWVSRDPLYEYEKEHPELLFEGPNISGYIGNDPLSNWDYLGLIAGNGGGASNRPRSISPRVGGPGAGHGVPRAETVTQLLQDAIDKSRVTAEKLRVVASRFKSLDKGIPEGTESDCVEFYIQTHDSLVKVADILEKIGRSKANDYIFQKGDEPSANAWVYPLVPLYNGWIGRKTIFTNDYPESLPQVSTVINEMSHLTGGVPAEPDPYNVKHVNEIPLSSIYIALMAVGASPWHAGYQEGLTKMIEKSSGKTGREAYSLHVLECCLIPEKLRW